MHPFFQIFFTMFITFVVGLSLLNILFRDGDETDRSVNECRDSWFPDLWLRGKFGFLMTALIVTAVGSFHGLPRLWQFLTSRL